MAGRKKQPSKMKVLKGTDQPCRMNPEEVEPDVEIPAPPEHLSKEAHAEWGRISEKLYYLGLLSQIDRAALAGYCQAYGRWAEAERKIAEEGMTLTTSNGNVIQTPYVSMANKSLEIMHKYLTEFGMTPSARAKVQANKPDSGNKSGFGAL